MKPFNLDEALKGAPVKLRNGAKAYVLANIKDLFPSTEIERPLIGNQEVAFTIYESPEEIAALIG